ncbi:MAG TPA: hypothetical protein VGD51_02730, partial [Nocardioidaceae bacterium]
AGPRVAQRVAESLAGAEVHVVLTVRDTAEVLPGLWQTHCANGGTASWPGFARSARFGAGMGPLSQPLGQGARLFRRALDVPRMLDVWAPVVPAERLHVVTVPRPGAPRELLWERFAGVVGIDPAVATRPAAGHNPSLGYASADLMRRLNSELGRLPRHRYNPTLKHYLAEQVLAERRGLEARAELDAAAEEFTTRWNRRVRTTLEASTAQLVGDLEDLPVTEPETPAGSIVDPPREELLGAAEHAAEGLERLLRRRKRRLERRGGDVADVVVDPVPGRRAGWEVTPDPVTAAVDDLAELTRVAISLHDRLTRTDR